MRQKVKLENQIRLELPPLVKRYKDGDTSAKEDIAVLLLPYTKFLVQKYKKSIGDSVDSLAGLIVTRIISKIHNLNLDKSFIGYLCRSIINYCIDKHRKFKRSPHKNVVKYLPYGTYDAYKSENTGEDTVRFFIESNFSTADAEILSLYYIDNKTTEEISIVTGQAEREIKETIDLAKQYI